MNIDYTAEIVGNQVVFKLNSINDIFPEKYQSDDGFLIINRYSAGESNGLFGYGALIIFLSNTDLPFTIQTPHYEYDQDLEDIMFKITKNMEIVNGDVLP
jgi:hypothetical protein